MKFNYQARTEKGEIQTGSIEASSKEAAVALLQKHGLYITFLEKASLPFYAKRIKIFRRISEKDIVLFSRQLSIMFKSEVSLVESLKVLSIQTSSPDFKETILKISEGVEGGTAFSKALSAHPKVFSSFYIAMVKSGEVSGKLTEVLNYLANHLEKEYHLKARTRGALIYPAFIIFVVILVLALLVFFVIPQLADVFEGTGQSLPLLTRIIIDISIFFRSWGWLVLLVISALIFFCFRYYFTEKGKNFFDRAFLRLPIIGPLLKMIYIARFAENLSTLISGGLPIARALKTVGDIIGNTSYREIIFKTRNEVRKGEPISSVLARSPELFSPVFVQMVLVGEKTGSLDVTLMNIVDFYQKEIDRTFDNVLSVIEPVLILFLGLIVAGLMLSIVTPLYQMVSF